MAADIDASLDYLIWSNTEEVTLTSPANAGDTDYTIAIAKRCDASYKEQLPTGGVYGSALKTWLLPAKLVTDAGATGYNAPRPAHRITESDGTVWTVQQADLNTLRSVWKCVSLDLTLAYNLRDTLTVKRASSITTDAAGGRTYTFANVYTDIPCRFQEQDGETSDERGKRLTVKRYLVPVSQRLYLTIEDQVLDADGNVYEVRGWRDADRIDQLQVLECERRW